MPHETSARSLSLSPSRPIRVLHVCDKFGTDGSSIHGVSRFLSWIFPRFDRERFDVSLVGLRPADTASELLRQEGLAIRSLGKGKYDLTTAGALVRSVHETGADILHLHGYGATNFGRLASRWTGVKNIVHEHFVDPARPLVQVPWDLCLARWVDQAIAVSCSVRDFMVEQRFLPADKIELLRYGAPLAEFKPADPERVRAEKRRWGIPPESRVIGTVGRLGEQKGNRYLLDAAVRVLAACPDVYILLVGDGPLAGELRAQAEANGVAGRVVFTGYSAEVALMQSLLDIQAFPSLFEGTPLAMFEAMSMRRSIVATHVDGLGEVLRHDETALLVPPRDAAALAGALVALLGDPALAERLAAAAELDSRRYDVGTTVERLQEIYERLVADRAA